MTTQIASRNTILVVDDNPDDFYAVQRELTTSGLRNPLASCESGQEALDFLYHRGRYATVAATPPPPALILLDINMPRMTGIELLRTIRGDERIRAIPVIIMTSSNDDRDVLAAFEGGANSYVLKPVNFDGLIRAIQRIKTHWFEILLTPKI
jgi:two-component system, response regulator